MQKFISMLLSGIFLMTASALLAKPQAEPITYTFLERFYDLFNSNDQFRFDFKPAASNLLSYKVTFADPTIASTRGFVDQQGRYGTFEGRLLTKPSKIRFIQTHFQQLDPSFNEFNLIAFAGRFPGKKLAQIVFVDANGQYAIVGGAVYDLHQGIHNNKTFDAGDANIHQDLATSIYKEIKKVPAVRQGRKDAPKTLYVLDSPSDVLPISLFLQLLPFVQSGELSVHWHFISSLSNEIGQGYAILEGRVPKRSGFPPTPPGALAYNFLNADLEFGIGGIPPIIHPSKRTKRIANANQHFIFRHFPFAAPIVIFKNANGQPDYIVEFTGDNIQAFIDNLFVKPAKLHSQK